MAIVLYLIATSYADPCYRRSPIITLATTTTGGCAFQLQDYLGFIFQVQEVWIGLCCLVP